MMSPIREIDRWFATRVFPHHRSHKAYAVRLTGNPADAEEIVQDAYARLFAYENWQRLGNPQAFVLSIIRNLAIDRFRQSSVVRIDRNPALVLADMPDERPLPDAAAEHRDELRAVYDAVAALPERCREAVTLRRIEGLSPGEVAERMGISVSTLEKHLVKGLRLLWTALGQAERTSGVEQGTQWDQTSNSNR